MRHWIILTSLCLFAGNSAANSAILRGPGEPGTGTPPNAVVPTASHTSDFKANPGGINQQATTGISLGAGQDLLRLTFWGKYLDNSNPSDNFTLRIWGPGTGLTSNLGDAIYNSTISAPKITYGNDSGIGIETFYQYTADFTSSPIAIPQTGDYFISIVNDTSNASLWGWTSTDNNLSRNVRNSETADWSNTDSGNLAFQSEHAPEPGSIGVLSVAALGLAYGAWRRRKKGKQSES